MRWGSFSVYGAKLHLLCSTNRVPLSYELTPASAADVLLVEELLDEARLGSETVRKLCGDLAYRSAVLKGVLAHRGGVLATERAERRPATRQQVEICFAALKRAFGLGAILLAKTLVGFATRIAARPQGRIKELWA